LALGNEGDWHRWWLLVASFVAIMTSSCPYVSRCGLLF